MLQSLPQLGLECTKCTFIPPLSCSDPGNSFGALYPWVVRCSWSPVPPWFTLQHNATKFRLDLSRMKPNVSTISDKYARHTFHMIQCLIVMRECIALTLISFSYLGQNFSSKLPIMLFCSNVWPVESHWTGGIFWRTVRRPTLLLVFIRVRKKN